MAYLLFWATKGNVRPEEVATMSRRKKALYQAFLETWSKETWSKETKER